MRLLFAVTAVVSLAWKTPRYKDLRIFYLPTDSKLAIVRLFPEIYDAEVMTAECDCEEHTFLLRIGDLLQKHIRTALRRI